MHVNTRLFFITLICSLTFNLSAQKVNNKDTLSVTKTVTNFFDWYIDAIKQKKGSEFQPTFAENTNNMTTLVFTKYIDNLIKYNFSDSLITKEKQSYQQCIDNLEKIKYADFEAKYTDLDHFESINCDFGNYYRWTGGQEPVDGINIKKTEFVDSTSVVVTIEYFNYNIEKKTNSYWGRNIISLIKTGNIWKIDNINWR